MNKQSFERKDAFPGIKIKGKSMTRPVPLKTIRQMLGDSVRSGIPLNLYDQNGEDVSDEMLEEMYFDPTLDKVEVEILSADVKAEINKYYNDSSKLDKTDKGDVSGDDAGSSDVVPDADDSKSTAYVSK